MYRISPKRRSNDKQSGYILLALIFAVTLMIIALATSLPSIGTQIRRDREDELVHRGHQYVRAIQLYYRKFGRYPNSIEDLENTNNMRFLRRKYTDPITGKDEWRLIHFGEAQVKPIPPYLNRAGGPGGGSGAGRGIGGATPAGGIGSQGGTGNSQGGTGAVGNGATNASSISSRIGTGGIGPIVGIASMSDKVGLKEIDGKTKYSDWEFVYDPSLDTSRIAGNNTGGQNQNPNQNQNNAPRPTRPGR